MAGTCTTGGGGGGTGGGAREIMLFGVRVVVDSMRKSVSLNNLSQYEQPQEFNKSDIHKDGTNNNSKEDVAAATAAGYASADDAVPHSSNSRGERKRGAIPISHHSIQKGGIFLSSLICFVELIDLFNMCYICMINQIYKSLFSMHRIVGFFFYI